MSICQRNEPAEGPVANYVFNTFSLVFNEHKRDDPAMWIQNLHGNTESYTDFILTDRLCITQKTVE